MLHGLLHVLTYGQNARMSKSTSAREQVPAVTCGRDPMIFDRATIDAILADIAAAKPNAQQNPPHVIHHNEGSENANVEAGIRKRGGTILGIETIHGVGTFMGGEVRRIHYQAPGGDEHRWAYVIPQRWDVDVFGEESLICSAPAYDDPSDFVTAIHLARAARKIETQAWLDRLDAVDAKWAHIWPAGLMWTPRALPRILRNTAYITYARQVYEEGPDTILTWPDNSYFEIGAKQDINEAVSKGILVKDTEPARMMAALIQIYLAAGVLQ